MKKYYDAEEGKSSIEAVPRPAQARQYPAAINFVVRDARLLQEEVWIREWETRNVKRTDER